MISHFPAMQSHSLYYVAMVEWDIMEIARIIIQSKLLP